MKIELRLRILHESLNSFGLHVQYERHIFNGQTRPAEPFNLLEIERFAFLRLPGFVSVVSEVHHRCLYFLSLRTPAFLSAASDTLLIIFVPNVDVAVSFPPADIRKCSPFFPERTETIISLELFRTLLPDATIHLSFCKKLKLMILELDETSFAVSHQSAPLINSQRTRHHNRVPTFVFFKTLVSSVIQQ